MDRDRGSKSFYIPVPRTTEQTPELLLSKELSRKRAAVNSRKSRAGRQSNINLDTPVQIRTYLARGIITKRVTLDKCVEHGWNRRSLQRWVKSESTGKDFKRCGAPDTLDAQGEKDLKQWLDDLIKTQQEGGKIATGASLDEFAQKTHDFHVDTISRRTGQNTVFVRQEHSKPVKRTLTKIRKKVAGTQTAQTITDRREEALHDKRALASEMVLLFESIRDPARPERNKHPSMVLNSDTVSVLIDEVSGNVRIVPKDYEGRLKKSKKKEKEFGHALDLTWSATGELASCVSFLGDKTMPDGFILKIPLLGWGNSPEFKGHLWIMPKSHPTNQCMKELVLEVQLPAMQRLTEMLPQRIPGVQEWGLLMSDGQYEQCQTFSDPQVQQILLAAGWETLKHHRNLRSQRPSTSSLTFPASHLLIYIIVTSSSFVPLRCWSPHR
jgi:hypothetical protein